jgi:hypothetical protein
MRRDEREYIFTVFGGSETSLILPVRVILVPDVCYGHLSLNVLFFHGLDLYLLHLSNTSPHKTLPAWPRHRSASLLNY